jgi:hypothetical protein
LGTAWLPARTNGVPGTVSPYAYCKCFATRVLTQRSLSLLIRLMLMMELALASRISISTKPCAHNDQVGQDVLGLGYQERQKTGVQCKGSGALSRNLVQNRLKCLEALQRRTCFRVHSSGRRCRDLYKFTAWTNAYH